MYQQRSKLSPYGEALLALTLHAQNKNDEAGIVCRNLVDTARIDRENGTASWQNPRGFWWYWYYDDTETTAWVLQALLAVDPKSDLTPMLVKWLVRHKQGTVWKSTKATAMTVAALMEYVRANHELDPDYTVTVALGDKVSRSFKINRENALLGDNAFLVPDSLLTDGPQTVTITKTGNGRCYFASSLQYFTTEEQIKGVGDGTQSPAPVFSADTQTRQTQRLVRRLVQRARLRPSRNCKMARRSRSGDLIEVELVLDAKNDYDYVAFEDMKPAGCEPVDLRSGGRYGDGLCSDMELRDTKTAFFVDRLPQGTRVLRYRMRAEIPGAFHAFPATLTRCTRRTFARFLTATHFTIEDAPQNASANLHAPGPGGKMASRTPGKRASMSSRRRVRRLCVPAGWTWINPACLSTRIWCDMVDFRHRHLERAAGLPGVADGEAADDAQATRDRSARAERR